MMGYAEWLASVSAVTQGMDEQSLHEAYNKYAEDFRKSNQSSNPANTGTGGSPQYQDFQTRFDAAVEKERQRRISAGMSVGEGWASADWLRNLKIEMLQGDISQRSSDLSNPNSKYYTDYAKQLKGTLSAQTSLNSLLGLNRAMGLSMTGSATIANEQRTALQGKITDQVGQATQNLWQNNQGQVNSLLGMQLSDYNSQQNNALQQQKYDDSKKWDWGGTLKTAGSVAALLLSLLSSSGNPDTNKNTKVAEGGGTWEKNNSGWWDYNPGSNRAGGGGNNYNSGGSFFRKSNSLY